MASWTATHGRRRRRRRELSCRLLGATFILAGTLHFTHTRRYVAIMPPYLPAHRELVYVSGVAEIAGGAGILIPRTRRLAGIGLVLLLAAVFPANFHMALHPEQIDGLRVPHWVLWARLPLQAPVMWWAWRATREA